MTKSNIYAAILVLLIATLVMLGALSMRKEYYVAAIGRYRIQKSEFYMYLYEQRLMFEKSGGADIWEMGFDGETGENVAKQNALGSITHVRLALDYATGQNITLTAQESETARLNGAAHYNSLLSALGSQKLKELGIDRMLCDKASEESMLYDKVRSAVTRNYELSDAEFERFYDDFYAGDRSFMPTNTQDFKDNVRERYISMKIEELFNREFEKWIGTVKIRKNESVWNEISVWDF